jgi:hypothetical protein
MATEVFYRGRNRAYRDTDYSPRKGRSLWESAPLLALEQNPCGFVDVHERWISYNAAATTGDYVLTQATTGAAAISTARSSVLELDSNSTTATQGATLQRAKAAIVPAAGSKIWAEFEFKIVDTFDKAEIFVGLSELDTTLIASSANSSANHIGWQCVTDDGVLLFTAEKAGAGATQAAVTIAEDTYVRLGFVVDGVSSITQYVNGVATGTAVATANVPIVALYPSFVCQSGGTNDPIMHLKPYRVLQVYEA